MSVKVRREKGLHFARACAFTDLYVFIDVAHVFVHKHTRRDTHTERETHTHTHTHTHLYSSMARGPDHICPLTIGCRDAEDGMQFCVQKHFAWRLFPGQGARIIGMQS